jgi:hypothetical protein
MGTAFMKFKCSGSFTSSYNYIAHSGHVTVVTRKISCFPAKDGRIHTTRVKMDGAPDGDMPPCCTDRLEPVGNTVIDLSAQLSKLTEGDKIVAFFHHTTGGEEMPPFWG